MYRGRYFIRESVYVCGDYMDADIYPVFQPAGKRRARCKPTSAIQEKLNQKTALRCLHPGKYRGRVTQIFPTGHRGVIAGCAAPAWCEGYEQGE